MHRTANDIEAKIAAAAVNPGWTPLTWAGRLEEMADRCGRYNPDRAAQLRRWAAAVRKANEPDETAPVAVSLEPPKPAKPWKVY